MRGGNTWRKFWKGFRSSRLRGNVAKPAPGRKDAPERSSGPGGARGARGCTGCAMLGCASAAELSV